MVPIIEIQDYSFPHKDILLTGLKELFREGRTFSAIPHRINYYQILLIEKGSGSYYIDEQQFDFTSKSFISLAKGQIEYFKGISDCEGYAVLFSDEYVYKYPEDLKWINKLILFDQTLNPANIKLNNNEFEELSTIFENMDIEFRRENNFAHNEILHHLLKIFLLTSERIKISKTCKKQSGPLNLSYLSEFKEKLEENYSANRSVNYYAGLLCITEKKLNQITSNYWGKTAKQVIEERVLLEIKRLLIYTDHTTKEIGTLLGFSDPANFNKFFKRYSAITPADFRCTYKNSIFDYKTETINNI